MRPKRSRKFFNAAFLLAICLKLGPVYATTTGADQSKVFLDLTDFQRNDQASSIQQNSETIVNKQRATPRDAKPVTQISKPEAANKSKSEKLKDEMQTSPSMTSVHHQVWTSSSSGSLNELSPEMIGRLRSDVPFLAAYAVRPRLVGGASKAAISASTKRRRDKAGNQAKSARQSLLPRLADFSELNIETSSLSRSEHSHRKKTSLRRDKTDLEPKQTGSDPSAEAGNLRRARIGRNSESKLRTGGRIESRRRASKGGSENDFWVRGRRKFGEISRLRKSRENLRKKEKQLNDRLVQGDSDDSIKGGSTSSRGDRKRKPFYSASSGGKPESGNEPVERNGIDLSDADNDEAPKRVGDDDVEEEGDTVTVMPKFDGVDDDPEPEDGRPVEDSVEERQGKSDPKFDGDFPEAEAENSAGKDSAARRVGREKPTGGNGNDVALGGGIGSTVGTSGASDGRGQSGDDDSDGNFDASSGTSSTGNDDGTEPKNRSGPGVEFVDDKLNKDKHRGDTDERSNTDHQNGNDGVDKERMPKGGSGNEDSNKGRDAHDSEDSGPGDVDYRDEMTEKDGEKERVAGEDLDERQLDGAKKHESGRGHGHKNHDNCDHEHHEHHGHETHDHHDTIKWLEDAIPGQPGIDYPILGRINSSSFNCRAQKYAGFYADVESRCQVFHVCQADGRQDSFLCPNGTIFSQISLVCVWWNSFDCEDAPKYYDLNALLYKSSQDSKSFKAISGDGDNSVEDARPKQNLPRANDEGNRQAAPIDELIRAMMGPRTGSDADSTGPGAIDQMGAGANGRAHSGEEEASMGRSSSEGADENDDTDGASIQRKQAAEDEDELVALDEEEDLDGANQGELAGGGSSARLRGAGKGNGELHRRERRASTKQGPLKLKSRRVSRYSRRRKLRHGIKPKRRA